MWHVYMVKCRDGSLYTGITTDIERRLEEHNTKAGARYTRSRAPVRLVYSERTVNRSRASKRESAIKKLSRPAKLVLVRGVSRQKGPKTAVLPKTSKTYSKVK